MMGLAGHTANTEFENLYFSLRKKEGRVYSDEELLHLPDIAKGHLLFDEWLIRKKSCSRLLHYLENKQPALNVWEPCCGNGWLSARLAGLHGATVIGTDINSVEIEQAVRVFNHIDNLRFQRKDCLDEESYGTIYDIIILASCIQYFSSPASIINSLLLKLRPGGEIHILDSPFYTRGEIQDARQRSKNYFQSAGFPEMSDHYFHHTMNEISSFRFTVFDRPSFFNRLRKLRKPFPWIRIKK